MSETTRPPGTIANPGLRAEAKRLWPGHPIGEQMLVDAAKLSGMPQYIAATPELARLGISQLVQEERARASQAGNARDLAAIQKRYAGHAPKPTKE